MVGWRYALIVIPTVAATVVGPLSEGLAAVAGQVEVGVPRPLVLGTGQVDCGMVVSPRRAGECLSWGQRNAGYGVA